MAIGVNRAVSYGERLEYRNPIERQEEPFDFVVRSNVKDAECGD